MEGGEGHAGSRRTTRSCSMASDVVGHEREGLCKSGRSVPALDDLVYRGEPLSYDDLLCLFPAREMLIEKILRLLGPVNSPMFPLLFYGGASTGKTSVVLQIFRHLNRPFVYASCLTCYRPRILFESVINQLMFHRKIADNGYSSARRCEKPSDFVSCLRESLISIIGILKRDSRDSGLASAGTLPAGNMIYLIFDNLDRVREWDGGSIILPLLFNLSDMLMMPEVGFIFIGRCAPDGYFSNIGYVEPISLYFPGFTEDDLRTILLRRNQTNQKLYSSFLDIVLRPFFVITRNLDELSAAFSPLFVKYCEPLGDCGMLNSEHLKRRLFIHFQPHVASSLNKTFWVNPSLEDEPCKETRGDENKRKMEGGGGFSDVSFCLSVMAKYLLLSAFLASRNPATLDAPLFDSNVGSNCRKRKKKPSEKSIEQNEITKQELLLKGPGTFPLDRLLAIFHCITSVADAVLEEEEDGIHSFISGGEDWQLSDVLLQLSSLHNANLIIKSGGGCPLEGSTRYRSLISEDLALKVARSMKFPLINYLYRS